MLNEAGVILSDGNSRNLAPPPPYGPCGVGIGTPGLITTAIYRPLSRVRVVQLVPAEVGWSFLTKVDEKRPSDTNSLGQVVFCVY